jgi:prepilin-type processing-associated H-X9-DG protein
MNINIIINNILDNKYNINIIMHNNKYIVNFLYLDMVIGEIDYVINSTY